MLSLRILISFPFSTIVVSALCAEGGFYRIISSVIRKLFAPDDPLLLLRGKSVPPAHIVQILLDDGVASALKLGVLPGDKRGIQGAPAAWIFRPVHKPKKVTIIVIAEAVRLVHGSDRTSDPLHDLHNQFETHIHPLGADVKQPHRQALSSVAFPRPDLTKRMELRRPGALEELVPCIRPESRDTREPRLDAAEIDRAKNSRQISLRSERTVAISQVRLDAGNEEYRGAGEWRKDGLGNRYWIFCAGWAHGNSFDLRR